MAKNLTRLFGLLILGIILWRTDMAALGNTLASCRALPLIAAFSACLLAVAVKGVRWKFLLNAQGFSYPVRRAVVIYFSGFYTGLVTPGKLGELARVLYVKRDFNTSAGRALSAFVLDRIFDLYALLLVGLTACFRFNLAAGFTPLFLLFVAVALVSPLVLLNPRLGRWFTQKLLGRIAEKRMGKLSANGANDFVEGIEALLSPRFLIVAVGFTVVAYVCIFGAGYLLTLSLDIGIGFVDAALVLSLANLLSLVPITVAGVGTRDAVFVLVFGVLGYTEAQALAFSALVLAIFFLGTGIVGLFCFLADSPGGNSLTSREGD